MKIIAYAILLITLLFSVGCNNQEQHTDNNKDVLKIGIIIPIAHPAMDEITAGFQQTLSATLQQPVQFSVMRAQGDINLQRAMISQLQQQDIDLFAPIATQTTEMTVAMIKDKPIIGLAALLPQQVRQHSPLALVNDEIAPSQIIKFIHAVYPDKKYLTIVYANNDKIIPQVAEAVAAANQLGIKMDKRMITTLPDLYSVAQSLSPTTEGIIVLKDVLVASGIATLANVANTQHIPLITADDGTVQNGAGFSVGVKEYDIGVAGANVAKRILEQHINPQTIPVVEMTKLAVFINPNVLKQQQQDQQRIEQQAKLHGYNVVDVMTLQQEQSHD